MPPWANSSPTGVLPMPKVALLCFQQILLPTVYSAAGRGWDYGKTWAFGSWLWLAPCARLSLQKLRERSVSAFVAHVTSPQLATVGRGCALQKMQASPPSWPVVWVYGGHRNAF